jgi:N-hydroxyarylamine O-acetyltransferase
MNISEYLNRIYSNKFKEISFENLKILQLNNLKSIAFENLDIYLNKKIEFGLENAYSKVMCGFRGGYCLEITPLFGWLLSALGYEIYYTNANIFVQIANKYTKYPTHILIVVKLENKLYYVDVVASFMVTEPIEIQVKKPARQKFATFQFLNDENGYFVLQRSSNVLQNGELDWKTLMRFKLEPKSLESFSEMNTIVQMPSHSTIANKTMCSLHTENSVRLLIGWKFSEIIVEHNEEKRLDKVLESIDEIREILVSKFHIKVDETLKPKDDVLPLDALL